MKNQIAIELAKAIIENKTGCLSLSDVSCFECPAHKICKSNPYSLEKIAKSKQACKDYLIKLLNE
jgi:hypothetical protein